MGAMRVSGVRPGARGATGATGAGVVRSSIRMPEWSSTSTHHRAVALGAAGALCAVLLRRADLLVLATPLLVVATWAWLSRPRAVPILATRVSHDTLGEGEAGVWDSAITMPPGAEDAILALAPVLFVSHDPPDGATAVAVEEGAPEGPLHACVAYRSTRWGVRTVGPARCSVTSSWSAYRTGPVPVGELTLTTLPAPAAFDPVAPVPHPEGLVGMHRSSRLGTGSEFSSIRAFHAGDRLRRIHWPVSLRTGSLHVSSTYADEDAEVVLLVDAFSDLGPREGVDGRPTSLDVTVRAAGAMAEHYLRIGDRVSMRVAGAEGVPRLRTGSGSAHLRRVLGTLALIRPATERRDDGRHATAGLRGGSLVIILSPLIDPSMVGIVCAVAARGMTTVVVDTMPDHLWESGSQQPTALAWRIRKLLREHEVRQLRRTGVPVVAWRGPASMDQVLRDVSRRAAAPRMVRR